MDFINEDNNPQQPKKQDPNLINAQEDVDYLNIDASGELRMPADPEPLPEAQSAEFDSLPFTKPNIDSDRPDHKRRRSAAENQ